MDRDMKFGCHFDLLNIELFLGFHQVLQRKMIMSLVRGAYHNLLNLQFFCQVLLWWSTGQNDHYCFLWIEESLVFSWIICKNFVVEVWLKNFKELVDTKSFLCLITSDIPLFLNFMYLLRDLKSEVTEE